MKYLKYAGLCAAGFFTEYLLSVVFSAFVTLLVLYPAAAIPCGILSGKLHVFYTKRIHNELSMPLVVYSITALGLPVLAGAAGVFINISAPELLTPNISSMEGSYAGLVKLLIFAAVLVNTIIITASGAYNVYKEQKMNNKVEMLINNIERSIIGKRPVIEKVVCAMLAGGHVLIEDVPGVGKTLLAETLAKSVSGSFGRIQFTPDLMPSDVIGYTVVDINTGKGSYKPGAAMCNFLLADEINRASPKVQSSLLEAMEERQITVDGRRDSPASEAVHDPRNAEPD